MNRIVKFFLFALTLCVLGGLIILLYTTSFPKTNNEIGFYKNELNENRLFDLNFAYILNSTLCSEDTFAVIIVTSYFGNVETRSAMRRAYSNQNLQDLKFRRVFLLGIAPADKYTNQKSVDNESRRFGDLIQGNFREAYRNLTYKHIMGLKWAARNCKSAQYVIKMDDDIVINFMKVVQMLKSGMFPKNNLIGYILNNMKPVREPANKWFVTKKEYENNMYPTFLSGWFYVTTPQISSKIVDESQNTPYLWIDDVYVTGILAKKLNIQYHSINEYFTTYPEFLQCCMREAKQLNYDCDILVGPNGGDNNLFYTFNDAMDVCQQTLCKQRIKSINETCVAERKVNLGRGDALVHKYQLF